MEGAAAAAPSPLPEVVPAPIVSEIGALATRVANGEPVEVVAPPEGGSVVYHLCPIDALPYVRVSYKSGLSWLAVNSHGWMLSGWGTASQATEVSLKMGRGDLVGMREQVARIVLAAIFAGRDMSALRCGQSIYSGN